MRKDLNRIKSVDTVKLLAIIAVISIHTESFANFSPGNPPIHIYLGGQLIHFAVPFFFVISGYFWGGKIKTSDSVASVSLPMAKKLLFIFATWSFIYAIPYKELYSISEHNLLGPLKAIYWNIIYLSKEPFKLLSQGTRGHLWFIIALICSQVITSYFVSKKNYRTLILFSIVLYVIGLLGKAYTDTPLGLHIGFNTRNGPFLGTIFFTSGFFLSNLTPNSSWFLKGLLIFVFGFLLHLSESYLLMRFYGSGLYHNYLIGTYFMGVGAAIASLSNSAFLKSNILSYLGKYTLGIYVIHLFFIDLLKPINIRTYSLSWEVGKILFVLFFSYASVMILSSNKFFKKTVS